MQNQTEMPARNGETTLVLGGTGKTGRCVAQRLATKGVTARVVSRSTQPVFDWHDERTWPEVLAGVTSAYINYAPDLAVPGATERIQQFVDAAVAAGVERLVLLSGRGEDEAQACERIVQAQSVEWTVVRASWFMQNFSEGEFAGMVGNGEITLPVGDVPEPFVDVNDIADVIVAALTEAGHAFETYEVTGPRLMTFAQIVEELSEHTGRDITLHPIPHEAFNVALAEAGILSEIRWLLNYLFSTVLDGRNAYVGDGVQRALGRKPTDFCDFIRRVFPADAKTDEQQEMYA